MKIPSELQSRIQKKCDQYNEMLSRISKKMDLISNLRLGVFFSFLVITAVLTTSNEVWMLIVSAVLHVGVFAWLIMRHQKFNNQKFPIMAKIAIAKQEMNILKLNLVDIDTGTEFLDDHDTVSFDLDLFGINSLFQLLNRTKTIAGRNLIFSWIKKQETDTDTIKKRQHAVKELSGKSSFIEEFQTALYYSSIDKVRLDNFFCWCQSTSKKFLSRNFVIFTFALPSLTILSLIFGLADLVSLIYFKWLAMAQFFIAMGFNRKVNNAQTILCNQFEVINSYCKCLKVIEQLEFESLELKSIKSRLFDEKHSSLPAMNKLSWLLNAFENRRHVYVSFVRNALFMYDLILMYYLEKWKTKNKDLIHNWIDDITKMEVMVSLGGFAELNPEFCYPELSDHYILKSENLGHPLIPVEKRICNDFCIEKNKSIFILTGANMSGKSTFLRTIGINLILAMMGAPVCASAFEFKPQKIRTSIRTNDSLHDGVSYFYAELQKIKQIMDELNQGTDLFVILDELLKGTNSVDKLHGSQEFLKMLVQYNVAGIVATHDLALADMVNSLPNNIRNISFDIQMNNDELNFDYKLIHGVSRNLSASFLMKKMGIIAQ